MTRLGNGAITAPMHFDVRVPPTRGGTEWVFTFSGHDDEISIQTVNEDKYCVRVDYNEEAIELGNFFNTVNTVLKNDVCNYVPHNQKETGAGSAVLQIVDVIACNAGYTKISLYDLSEFQDARGRDVPDVASDNMTETLALLRGYGFYEARGYVPTVLAESVLKEDPSKLQKGMEADLAWTHMIATTPTNKLTDAIRDFHETLIGPSVYPEFTVDLYSKENCERYARRAKEAYVDNLLGMLANFERETGCLQLVKETSMRELAKAMTSGEINCKVLDIAELSSWVKIFMGKVWQRPLTWEDDTRVRPNSYPGKRLTKLYYRQDERAAAIYTVRSNSLPTQPPVVSKQPTRTDMTVAFKGVI